MQHEYNVTFTVITKKRLSESERERLCMEMVRAIDEAKFTLPFGADVMTPKSNEV